uniref:Peroxidase 10 n=1 Tax=Solanum tuberosum TaxID=4113 RepID=M0ZZQ3_SOLTU
MHGVWPESGVGEGRRLLHDYWPTFLLRNTYEAFWMHEWEVQGYYTKQTLPAADYFRRAMQEDHFGQFYLVVEVDYLLASEKAANEQLPSPFEPLDKIVAKFTDKGLDLRDLVVPSDIQSVRRFDNAYYRNLMNNSGLLESDVAAMNQVLDQSSGVRIKSCLNVWFRVRSQISGQESRSGPKLGVKFGSRISRRG